MAQAVNLVGNRLHAHVTWGRVRKGFSNDPAVPYSVMREDLSSSILVFVAGL